MGKAFQKFLRLGVDLAPLGVERREDDAPYFCTPKGASIFGWTGADGVHFCFVRGFGETVFAISPMSAAPDHVHPIARDFTDFLRLLLTCGGAEALEQAWAWDKARFEAFLRENAPTEEQEETLAAIAERMKLTAMEQPWEYLRALQASFDYGRLRYTEDYYDADMNPAAEVPAPEWRVYFEGGFWDHRGKDRPGTAIPVGKSFSWADRDWLVPAVYSCGKGLVVDLCTRAEAGDPPSFDFLPRLTCNGRALACAHGRAVSFDPRAPESAAGEREAKWAAEHYGLDLSRGWAVFRFAFPWAGGRRPGVETLLLTVSQEPARVLGPSFTAHAPGDTFRFTHPASGTEYTLTVRELERQTMPEGAFGPDDGMIYPTHLTAMSYTLTPDASEEFYIDDSDGGDRPIAAVPPANDPLAPAAVNCAAVVGIIGGADGPTAIVLGSRARGRLHAVCSSLHFEPVRGDVTWRVTFCVQRYEDLTLPLL